MFVNKLYECQGLKCLQKKTKSSEIENFLPSFEENASFTKTKTNSEISNFIFYSNMQLAAVEICFLNHFVYSLRGVFIRNFLFSKAP